MKYKENKFPDGNYILSENLKDFNVTIEDGNIVSFNQMFAYDTTEIIDKKLSDLKVVGQRIEYSNNYCLVYGVCNREVTEEYYPYTKFGNFPLIGEPPITIFNYRRNMKVYNKYKEKREKYLDEITDLYKEFLEKETGKKVNVDKESEKYIDYNQTYEHMYFQIVFKLN